jgi:methionine-rich copper-binding protein CopC
MSAATPSPRRLVRLALLLVLGCAALAAVRSVRPAHAQPSMVSSNPADKATLDSAPATIQITFANRVVGGPTSFISVMSNNVEVTAGRTRVDGYQGTLLYVPLRPGLIDGQYVVTWGVTDFDDGSEASGSFTFNIATQPIPATASDGGWPRPSVMSVGDGSGSGIVQVSQINGAGYQLALALSGMAPSATYTVSICSMDGDCSLPDPTLAVTSSPGGLIVFTLYVPFTEDFAGMMLTNVADPLDSYEIAYTPGCC